MTWHPFVVDVPFSDQIWTLRPASFASRSIETIALTPSPVFELEPPSEISPSVLTPLITVEHKLRGADGLKTSFTLADFAAPFISILTVSTNPDVEVNACAFIANTDTPIRKYLVIRVSLYRTVTATTWQPYVVDVPGSDQICTCLPASFADNNALVIALTPSAVIPAVPPTLIWPSDVLPETTEEQRAGELTSLNRTGPHPFTLTKSTVPICERAA